MLALYRKSEQFVLNEMRMFGAGSAQIEKSKAARIKHFRLALQNMPQDIEDSDAAMAALNVESVVFDEEERTRIAAFISQHMSSDVATPAGDTKLQDNNFLYNYVPGSVWHSWKDSASTWDAKCELGIDLLLTIRCRNPQDAVYKMLLAMLASCHGKVLSPQDCYDEIKTLKAKMFNKRRLHPGEQALLDYPENVNDFIESFPHCFCESDMPVPPRVDVAKLHDLMRKDRMPTRGSNVALKSPGQSPKESFSSDQFGLMRMCMEFMLGNRSRDTLPPMSMMQPGVRKNALKQGPAPLPIEDGAQSETIVAGPAPKSTVEVPDAASVLANARNAIAKRGGKASRDDEIDDESSGEEGIESDHDATLRKPAALKRPAAVASSSPSKSMKVCRKPSQADAGDGLVPSPTVEPTHYHGGKIYYGMSGQKLRVYARRGDRIDSSMKVDYKNKKQFKTAWKWALNKIVSDPRPVR